MRPHIDAEYEKHPHVIMTSNSEWNQQILDHEIDDEAEDWFDMQEDLPFPDNLFDDEGTCIH